MYLSKVGNAVDYMNQIAPEKTGEVIVLSLASCAPGQAPMSDSGMINSTNLHNRI